MYWQGVLQTPSLAAFALCLGVSGPRGGRAQQASRQGVLAEEVMLYRVCLLCWGVWACLALEWRPQNPAGKVEIMNNALFVLTGGRK